VPGEGSLHFSAIQVFTSGNEGLAPILLNPMPEGTMKHPLVALFFAPAALGLLPPIHPAQAQSQVGNYASHATSGRSVVVTGATGESLRITPYGDYLVRVQVAKKGEDFYADDRYQIVASHDWKGTLAVDDGASALTLSTAAADGVSVSIAKQPMRISFSMKGQSAPALSEKAGTSWSGNTVKVDFTYASDEHFAGLGHETKGHIAKLDRRGTSMKVGHGSEGQAIVPFFVSSKGYGVFLNTTFTHTINLGQSSAYGLTIDGEGYGGQMDYFFIAGPAVTQVLDRYTQLVGRPRMPQKSQFGLNLSDKSDPGNNGEAWWKKMINDHRTAGYAFDHQVNDNAWRASNEATSGQANSWFDWRKDRYPDPAEYKKWCDENGVTVTLDLNRPGLSITPGWSDSQYGMPGTKACPDFTKPAARKWLWNLFFSKSLDPALKYPGDAIWLDEFDYPDQVHSMTLSSGKRWAEESINYQYALLESLVKEGWDVDIGEAKRPYFWSRGITAGAQRWGSYWSGDIDGNWTDMAYQVRAMQSAGISGFPYFNHDAGGHVNLTENNDNVYRQWDMAFGSFTPIWKPHGPSHTRWPLQRNATCQATAKTYITTRYQMMPYIYSYAHIAQATGVPMVRAMFLEDQTNATAWEKDMQYYWGHEMLVAPNCDDGGNAVSVWLPKGNWYSFWDDKKYAGDKTESISAATGVIPAFVREGAVIPMAPFAKSTFFIPKDTLAVHVYAGADGSFALSEDDGVSEKYRTKNELRTTNLRFVQKDLGVLIGAAQGTFSGAPTARTYSVIYHGLADSVPLFLDGTSLKSYATEAAIPATEDGATWDATKKLLIVHVSSKPVSTTVWIANAASATSPGDVIPDAGAAGAGGGSPDAGAGGSTGTAGKSGGSAGAAGGSTSSGGGAGGVSSSATSVASGGKTGSSSSQASAAGANGGAGGKGSVTSAAAGSVAGGASANGGTVPPSSSAAAAENKSSGCSCAMGGHGRAGTSWSLAFFLAAFIWVRRRFAARK
jgi:alpha-D-xyloside xylohydrolase